MSLFLFQLLLFLCQKHLEGTFPVDCLVIFSEYSRSLDKLASLGFIDCSDLAQREQNLGLLNHGRGSLFIQERDQRLSGAEIHDGVRSVESRIGTECLCCDLDGFLVFRSVGSEGMLDAVAKLAEDGFRNVSRTLGDEIDSDSLAPDQPYDLLDLVGQRLAGPFEKHVRLVEEEDQFREFHVSDLREGGVELGEEPEQEC